MINKNNEILNIYIIYKLLNCYIYIFIIIFIYLYYYMQIVIIKILNYYIYIFILIYANCDKVTATLIIMFFN